jgi:hypothetical protein
MKTNKVTVIYRSDGKNHWKDNTAWKRDIWTRLKRDDVDVDSLTDGVTPELLLLWKEAVE